jgi:ABC-type antimicrobial peptide transport system permease subunit
MPMLVEPLPGAPPSRLFLTVRARDIEGARGAIRAAVTRADPAIPFVSLEPLDVRVRRAFRGFRELTIFAFALGAIALLLSAAGLYALLFYMVRRRSAEIGVRVALGARSRDVVALVIRPAIALVAIGGLTGVFVASGVAELMRSALYGISPYSPWGSVPTIGLLLMVSMLACAIPAYQALRVDPMTVLREP